MKRFTETTKWRDPWYRKLSGHAKNLWQWLLDHCDNSGVVDIDLEAASFDIRETINEDHLTELSSRLKKLDNGKYWVPKFVGFQYGTLSSLCRPHANVIQLLNSHGLMILYKEAYAKGINTLQEKDPHKDKDKDKDKYPDKDSKPIVETPVRNFPEVETPSWEEFWKHSSSLGMPEFYAKDKFLAADQENWARARNWRAYATRCFNWWVQDGRPKQPVKKGPLRTGEPQQPKEINGSTSYLLCPGNTGVMGV